MQLVHSARDTTNPCRKRTLVNQPQQTPRGAGIPLGIADMTLNADGTAYRGTRAIRLTVAETALLKTLMSAPRCVFTRAELRESVFVQREEYYREFVDFLL